MKIVEYRVGLNLSMGKGVVDSLRIRGRGRFRCGKSD